VAKAPPVWTKAAERWGYLAEGQAHRYGVANGATLLLKIASGESGFNQKAVSSAGARGGTQFIASTRQSFIDQYGVDPWKSPDEAMHAAALFMKHSGLAAYNPGGGQEYIDYILGQKVGVAHPKAKKMGHSRVVTGARPAESSASSGGDFGSELLHIGLVGALVLGGATMIGLGATRMLGTAQAPKGAT
jgi:hypothetical protein